MKPWPVPLAGLLVAAVAAAASVATPVAAGPVVCTTSLEAPQAGAQPPVEVTRCGPVVTTPELVERRFYGWTSPYARGIDITH